MGLRLKDLTYNKKSFRTKMFIMCWRRIRDKSRWKQAYYKLQSYGPNYAYIEKWYSHLDPYSLYVYFHSRIGNPHYEDILSDFIYFSYLLAYNRRRRPEDDKVYFEEMRKWYDDGADISKLEGEILCCLKR